MSKSAPDDAADGLNEKSRLGWVLGWVWMVFAALNVVDILRHPWDRSSAYAGSVLLLVSAIVWVLWLRPRLCADSERVLLRNPLRDVELPWGAIDEIESHDTVRFTTERRSYHSWVGHVPNRRRTTLSRSKLRQKTALFSANPTGRGQSAQHDKTAASNITDAEFIVQRLTAMADQNRRKSKEAGHTAEAVRWSRSALAVLGAPVLLLVISILVP